MPSGIRVSQAGIPVARAADYQKNMDERWPLLEFSLMEVIDITVSNTSPGAKENSTGSIVWIPFYEHNLGFLPGFRVINVGSKNYSQFNDPLDQVILADEKYLWLELHKSAGPSVTRLNMWIALCPRNLRETFSAPVEHAVAGMTTSPSPYGIKIVEPGNDIEGRDKHKFNLNTNAKSMNIQMHGQITANPSTGTIQLDHNLGYPPTYYLAGIYLEAGAFNPMAGKTVMGAFGTVISLASSTATRLTVRGGQAALSGDYMYVVLKDPVDTAR